MPRRLAELFTRKDPQLSNGGDLYSPWKILKHNFRIVGTPDDYLELLQKKNALTCSRGPVLDLCAGNGLVSQHFYKKNMHPVIQYDGSTTALTVSEGVPNKTLGIAQQLPFADNSFSLVHCKDAAIHIPNLALLFSEVERCLWPGGRFILTTVDYKARKYDRLILLSAKHYHTVSFQGIRACIRNSKKLKIIEEYYWKPEKPSKDWYKGIPHTRRVFIIKKNK